MIKLKNTLINTVIGVLALITTATGVQASEAINTYNNSSDAVITEYEDNSFSCIGESNGTYEFTPCNQLGDWNYTCNSKEDLNKLIKSYDMCKGDYDNIKEFYIVDTYTKNDGSIVNEYNDNSWSLSNTKTNKYIFMPAITEDTEIELDSMNQLNNIIATYKSLKENGFY